jgi:TrmH family RNA methyltransferase
MMLAKITSAANPTIKMLKSLHAKKARQETGLFLAEGARLAIEAADLDILPAVLAVAPAALERSQTRALIDRVSAQGGRCIETTEAILTQITRRDNAQAVIGAYRQTTAPLDAPFARGDIVIALEGVRDPGNLGAIVRTADAMGAGGVALIGATCDPFSVECVRATMGSIFAVPIARAEFAAFDVARKAHGFSMVGASLAGTQGLDAAPGGKIVALMGNEQSGLPEAMEQACDALVKLPMRGRADSLNLAIATAITAYDLWRRRDYDGAR